MQLIERIEQQDIEDNKQRLLSFAVAVVEEAFADDVQQQNTAYCKLNFAHLAESEDESDSCAPR